MFAVIIAALSGLCLDSSDIAYKLCLISSAYIVLYTCRWEIAKAVYKAVSFYVEAFKEAKAGVKR